MQDRVQGVSRISDNGVELRENKLVDRVHHKRSNDDARDAAYSANDDHRQVDDGVAKAKGIRRDHTQLGGVIGSSDAREERAGSEGQQFCIDEVDPGRRCRDFVLANSDPGAPHAGVTQANIRKDHQGDQGQDQIVVWNWRDAVPYDTRKSRREDAGNAISSPGDVIQLEKDNRDDFSETQRHDGEIISSQAQGRSA